MALSNTRCSVHDRISKQTVLTMLQSVSATKIVKGQRVQWTDSQGKTNTYRVFAVGQEMLELETEEGILIVPKSSVIGTSSQLSLLDKMNIDDWEVESFDAKSRLVCIKITNRTGTRHLSVTLPIIT